MSTLQVCAVLLSLTALFLFCNNRFLRLPNTVGLMLLSLASALLLGTLQFFGFAFVGEFAHTVIAGIDLDEAVLNGFLCLLLFVGAIHVDVRTLMRQGGAIMSLATIGVLLSTLVVGTLFFVLTALFGLAVPFLYCLIFGALISPTDAVTVLSFLKKITLPESIESKITGESLLNDGMSIVLFSSLVALTYSNHSVSLTSLPLAILWDMGGALLIGLGTSVIAHVFISAAADNENPYIAIMTTLALATSSYALADALGASGPIAVVVAGLYLGNRSTLFAADYETAQNVSNFWDLIDEVLNAILFVIIGLELLAISTVYSHLAVAALAIPVVLAARFVSITLVIKALKMYQTFPPYVSRILTWGGLRGGISIALALSLPAGELREIIMTATYFVVLFSVFVQGPTLAQLVADSSPVVAKPAT